MGICSIFWGDMVERLMLQLVGLFVLESGDNCIDVLQHGQIYLLMLVVPVQGETNVFLSSLVC